MTPLFAIAIGITAIMVLVTAMQWWRKEGELMVAAALGLPALAFLAAAIDALVRVIA